jgi:putative ABC transport system permease protein
VLATALKILGVLLGAGLALALLVVLVMVSVAMFSLIGITVCQWRDLFSSDRWSDALITLGRNKTRTFLTAVSVAWGVFVLIFMLGLGRGLDRGMRVSFAKDAANGVFINPNKTSVPYGGYGVGRRIKFENADYERAKAIKGIEFLSAADEVGNGSGAALITRYGVKASRFEVDSVYEHSIRLHRHTMVQGRFINLPDILQRRKSAVIGQTASKFLFDDADPIGEWINVGSVAFQVVGVYTDESGAGAQLAFNSGEKLGQLQMTLGDAGPGEAKAIIETIVGQLAERHQFAPNDRQAVRVYDSLEQLSRFRKLFWMISTFVLVIGLATLTAGLIGVSNVMLIAVKERTNEIGVRKALGATPRSIVFMIVQEAVLLTSIAGSLGLFAGIASLQLVGHLGNGFLVNPNIDFSIGIAAAVLLIAGAAVAGYFPARAAARVNPIQALRDA